MENQQFCPPLHREHFESWLERQPEDRVWNYVNNEQCVWCSFMREFHGIEVMTNISYFTLQPFTGAISLPEWFWPVYQIAENVKGEMRADVRMPALREFFGVPKEQPSPFTMAKETAAP